jgi:pilus assembly protein CpaB
MFRSTRRMLGRFGRWPRLCAAGICLLLAAASAVQAHQRTSAENATSTAGVVVATRALPAGRLLVRGDLTVAHWPRALRPPTGLADPHALVGRRLAGPVGAREAVTSGRVLGADLTSGLSPGEVATPVTVDDPGVGQLVHAGDRVDVLATAGPDPPDAGPKKPETVASRAVVLAVLTSSDSISGTPATGLIVATDRPTALRIAGMRSSYVFAVVGDSP